MLVKCQNCEMVLSVFNFECPLCIGKPDKDLITDNPIKIGLYSSVMQSGKTTCTNYLIDKYNFKRVVLAKPLKEMNEIILRNLGYDERLIKRHVYGDLKEEIIPELGISCRYIQQTLGTEWRNMICIDLWLKTLNIQLLQKNINYICEDIRFPHEYEYFKNNNYILIKIEKPDAKFLGGKHASEGGLDNYKFDYKIINDGSLEDLYEKLNVIISKIKQSD